MKRRVVLAGAAVAVSLLTGCGDSPTRPAPVPTDPPQITCGESITIDNVTQSSQAVTFPLPALTGGAPPVTETCTPASGTLFPLGATTVTCTAVDAQSRQSTCSFQVTLHHSKLAVTTFLAFGDSMTAGENGRPLNFIPVIDLPNAYPTILQQLFAERIPAQPMTVFNEGLGGERVTDIATIARLKEVIAVHQPQAVLLLEGANDMLGKVPAAQIANGLVDLVRTAQGRGIQYVFVSTELPFAPGNCLPQPAEPRCRGADAPESLPTETNELLRAMVPATGAHLVDTYDAFLANRSTYIDIDGLHPRPEGNRALAQAFWDSIVREIPAQLLGVSR